MKRTVATEYLLEKARILPITRWLPKLNKSIVVSVVIPAYNEANFVGNLLMALNKQTLDKAKYEVLVVNNGSTDNTVEKIKKIQPKLAYPLYLLNEKRPGAGNARKTGIDEVIRRYIDRSNDVRHYIAITDADAIPTPHWLTTIIETLQSKSKSAAVSGTYHAGKNVDRYVEKKLKIEKYFLKPSTICDYLDKLVGQTRLRGPNSAFEIECYAAAGGFEQPVNNDGTIAPRECFQLSESIRVKGYEIYSLNLPVIASQRRKLFELINKSSTYTKVDPDKKRFLSVRDSENKLLKFAVDNLPKSAWLKAQQQTLCVIIKNVLLVPIYNNPNKIIKLHSFMGDKFIKILAKDTKTLDLDSMSKKWSPIILKALEEKLTTT